MKMYNLKKALPTLLPDTLRVNGTWWDIDGDVLDKDGVARWGSYHYIVLQLRDDMEIDEVAHTVKEGLAEYAKVLEDLLDEINAWIGRT